VLLEKRREWVPLKRIGSPEEIARGTIFLLAPENTYTTGEAFFIDGGAQTVGMNLVPGRT
jgi:NAD(P)-dependent dehydrogenase (short-subunit alcohol dehydrogenase family)